MTRAIAIILIVTGALLLAIPVWLFPVCFHAGGGQHARMMPCFATGTITQWLGAATLFCALLVLFASSPKVKMKTGALLIAALAGASLFFIYLVVPGVCRAITMPCRVGTLPAALVTGGVQALAAAAGLAARKRW